MTPQEQARFRNAKETKSEAAILRWQNLTVEQKMKHRENQAAALRRYWASMTPEQRIARSQRLIEEGKKRPRRKGIKGGYSALPEEDDQF